MRLPAALALVTLAAASGCDRQVELAGAPPPAAATAPNRAGGEAVGDQAERSSGDPCRLLTEEEAQIVVGGTVQGNPTGEEVDLTLPLLAGMAMCHFTFSGGTPPGTALVSFGLAASARRSFSAYEAVNQRFDVAPVPGVGQEALWDEPLRTLLVLTRDGSVVGVKISVDDPGTEDLRQRATWLAQRAIGRT